MNCLASTLSAAALVLLSMGPAAAQAQQEPRRAITQISGDLYRVQNERHFSVALVTPDGIIITDPINREFATWLKAALAERFGKRVKYVLYSHSHFDHASGGEVFADTARFVGHENMLAYLKPPTKSAPLSAQDAKLDSNGNGKIEPGEAQGRLQTHFAQYDANRDGGLDGAEIARGPVGDVRAPDITYRDRMTISLGGHEVELTWPGPMLHSNDMSVIRFPQQDTVYVVDFIQIKSLPFGTLGNGRLDSWLGAIRKVEEMDFSIVAPGHNVLGAKADIADFRQYVEDLRDAVRTAMRSGQSVEQLQQSVRMDKYRDWFMHDAWLADNVVGMYRLLGSPSSGAN